ncbi:MAG: hypothetical protein COA38_14405 [Fluviicola sp.]|nr:MAG: hypothetical protein COA38_14405 [Fluviicola sp.]
MRLVLIISLLLLSFPNSAQDFSSDTTIARIQKLSSQKDKAAAFNLASASAWINGNLKESLEYSERGLKIARALKYKSIESKLHNNRGITYDYLSQYPSALKHFFAGLSIQEKLDDPKTKADILGNIGLIYMNQELESKSLSYHKRALKIRQEINDQHGISASLNNIAIIYTRQEKHQKAINNYMKCIEMDAKANDSIGLGDNYNNIALAYMDLKEFDIALDYLDKALAIRKSVNNIGAMAITYSNFGEVHYRLGDFDKAREYFNISIELGSSVNDRECLKFVYYWLTKNEEKAGDSISAFRYYKLYITYRDSIDNSSIARKQTELELNYEFNKEKEVSRLREKEKDRQHKIIIIAISSGLILILLFSILFFRKWKQTQAQQDIIEEKNKLVQQKNDEIMASISYAKRIQKAILPSKSTLQEVFPNHFVLYLPKDIVSGDFYWLDETDDLLFLAVADCTGHGVPGALMSVVCHNALNRSVREYGHTSPAEILNKTRDIVITELTQQEDAVADGMDISLCVFDKKSNKLHWSGANNPLWILRNATKSIEVWKANKQPIGNHRNPLPFTNHTIELSENDCVFLFSDGYQDQFGGPKEKKMMRKGFKDALLESNVLPISEQSSFMLTKFRNWQADLEQVDDLCVIGIQIGSSRH